ncbi:MAG: 2-amino-4-hydroxy-6-hydroxymethyldihydropteridine diphosphokinase [Proteobacteria bacterium]|nr:2-amino-4-hydroxy-6-hydroxymethyldihydropteridine diphosphokinase [Pseudomonadota bacterium]
MKTAYIGLGSNLGDSLQILRQAWLRLGQEPAIRPAALSSPYRTEPVAMASQHWFVNAVACLQTSMPPRDLLHTLLATEKEFGRTRGGNRAPGYQDRILDLDLLLYDDLICNTTTMTLPHPEMHRRLFVLAPLREIAPDCVHPLFRRTAAALLTDLAGARRHPVVQRISWPDPPGHKQGADSPNLFLRAPGDRGGKK